VKTDPTQNSAEGGETRQELARSAGVSHDTIAKVKHIAARAAEPVKAALRRGARRDRDAVSGWLAGAIVKVRP